MESCECETSTETIRSTIAKMLSAHTTISDGEGSVGHAARALCLQKHADGRRRRRAPTAAGEPTAVCGTIVLIIGGGDDALRQPTETPPASGITV